MKIKKSYLYIGLIITLVIAFYMRVHIKDLFFELKKISLPNEIGYGDDMADATSGINLAVPFSAQAPYGDWSPPYDDRYPKS